LATIPVEIFSLLISEEQPNPYLLELAKSIGQLTLPVAVGVLFVNSIEKQILASKESTEKQILATKESTEKQILATKESTEKQILATEKQIAATREITTESIKASEARICFSIDSLLARICFSILLTKRTPTATGSVNCPIDFANSRK